MSSASIREEKQPARPKVIVYNMYCLFLPWIFSGLVHATVCVSSQSLCKTNMPISFL